MAVQADIVLANGEGTPVNKTFVPMGAGRVAPGKHVADWQEQSAVNAEGFYRLSESRADPNSNKISKLRTLIELPTLQTVGTNDAGFTPVAGRLYSTVGVVEIWSHVQASQAELKDIVAFVKNYTASALFSALVLQRSRSW